MRGIIALAAASAALLCVCGSGSAQTPTAPPTPSGATETSICRPSFQAGEAAFVAGTAFLLGAEGSDKVLLVTAMHLFGPGGGLEKDVPWDLLPAQVKMRSCQPYRSDRPWNAAPPLAITGAHPGFSETDMRDIAAFPLKGKPAQPPLHLASHAPAVGDSVWLVAEIIDNPAAGLMHHASVLQVTGHSLVIAYDTPFSITATSGAPIVDARGHVVGVNYGGGQRSGRMLGLATSLDALRAALGAKLQ